MHNCDMSDNILTELAVHIIMSTADSTIGQSDYTINKAKDYYIFTTQ